MNVFVLFSEAESRRKELDDDLSSERNAMVACGDRMDELAKEIQQVEGDREKKFSVLLQFQSKAKWYRQVSFNIIVFLSKAFFCSELKVIEEGIIFK